MFVIQSYFVIPIKIDFLLFFFWYKKIKKIYLWYNTNIHFEHLINNKVRILFYHNNFITSFQSFFKVRFRYIQIFNMKNISMKKRRKKMARPKKILQIIPFLERKLITLHEYFLCHRKNEGDIQLYILYINK